MTVVDASVWIDYLRGSQSGESQWLDEQLSIGKILLPTITLCEVLQGIRSPAEFERTQQILLGLECVSITDQKLCIEAARNYRLLREQGVTVRSTIDCLIATFCIQNNHALLHHDRDFEHFEQHLGLRVVKV